jgi:multiple sugar transport system ATP-binding protein
MNLLRGRVADGRIRVGDVSLPWTHAVPPDVAVGVRPEDLSPANGSADAFAFTVEVVEPLGNEVVVHGSVPGAVVDSGADDDGAEIPIAVSGARAPLTAIFAPADQPRPGDTVDLTVSPDRVHLFDLSTGMALRS